MKLRQNQNNWSHKIQADNFMLPCLILTGFPVTEEQLEEAATESGVLHVSDYLPPEVRAECLRIIPHFENKTK